MAKTDQFQQAGDPPDRKFKMVCAIWRMTPRSHIFIGAPDKDALEAIWEEITGSPLDRSMAQTVCIMDGHHFPEPVEADEPADESTGEPHG